LVFQLQGHFNELGLGVFKQPSSTSSCLPGVEIGDFFHGTYIIPDIPLEDSFMVFLYKFRDLSADSQTKALVCGANLVYHPNFMKMMSDFNFLSPDSQCWSFDQKANGYARGEGFVTLVVKRLDQALSDGDTIRAVVRNTGSNQDGRTPGITQPSYEAQVELIQRTYQQIQLDMGPTRYFEAHGTGTPVGDPVEANAIGTAFRSYRTCSEPMYVGATKANVGHLEGASGLAGIVKAVMVLETGIIPPIANFETINKKIDAEDLRLHVSTSSFHIRGGDDVGLRASLLAPLHPGWLFWTSPMRLSLV
jgi:3-oxoacyl-(acyl-carrier-protein) synthase